MKTALCDSCGKMLPLFDISHNQAGSTKVWHYCEICKFSNEVEINVNKELKILMQTNPAAANTPSVVSEIRNKVSAKMLSEKL